MEALLSETPVVVPLFLGRPEARYRYEHILNEWHHMMGLGLIPCVKTPRNTEEFSRAIVLVITEGSEKSRVDVDLDWLCKKTDYVTEVSDFVKLRLGNRYDKNALL
jgi:hypothetical protein